MYTCINGIQAVAVLSICGIFLVVLCINNITLYYYCV